MTWKMLAATPDEVIPSGAPGWNFNIARVMRANPNGKGAIIMDGYGGMHGFKLGKSGAVPKIGGNGPYWNGWDIAKDFVITDWSKGSGYVLDAWGGIHSFGGAPATSGGPYWQGKDLARKIVVRSDQKGGYVLDAWGGIHPFAIGNNPKPAGATGGSYWNGWDIARAITLNPNNTGGYVLDGWGGIHTFAIGNSPKPPEAKGGPYWKGQDNARDLVITDWSKGSGFLLETQGNIFGFGGSSVSKGVSKSAVPYISLASVNGYFYAMNGNGTILTSSPPNSLIFNDVQIRYFQQLEEAKKQQEAQAAATATALQQLVASCYQQTIRQGSKGDCVKILQNAINGLSGSKLAVDGDFDPATAGAVKNYQCGVGIGVDGVVGSQTWGAIQAGKQGNRQCGGGSGGNGSSSTSGNNGTSRSAPSPAGATIGQLISSGAINEISIPWGRASSATPTVSNIEPKCSRGWTKDHTYRDSHGSWVGIRCKTHVSGRDQTSSNRAGQLTKQHCPAGLHKRAIDVPSTVGEPSGVRRTANGYDVFIKCMRG